MSANDEASVDPLLTETAERLFEEFSTHEAVQAAEADGFAPQLWDAFTATGFAHISIPETSGGSGGTLLDAQEILRLAGYYAAPIPAAETAVLGGWLLSQSGLSLPDGPLAVPTRLTDEVELSPAANQEVVLNGTLHNVPWARAAARLVFLVSAPTSTAATAATNTAAHWVVSVDPANAKIYPSRNMAGEPRDKVTFEAAPAEAAPAPAAVNPASLRLRGALSRVALMAGAIKRMSQLTVSYTNERVQFGRPVARFQAVQQHLVWAAQDAALLEINAHCAARSAWRCEDSSPASISAASFEIAAAKLIANQAAARATKACHQAHGAMGMTQEYPLHHLSRRLWSWRQEYGSEAEWSQLLGDLAIAEGADGLYPLITSGKPTAA